MQLYVIILQPFTNLWDSLLQIVNESGLMILSVCYFFFTDMSYNVQSKINVGWTCIFAVLVGVAINGAFILTEIVRSWQRYNREELKNKLRA